MEQLALALSAAAREEKTWTPIIHRFFKSMSVPMWREWRLWIKETNVTIG
jgi:hypothetical protein